VPVIAAQKTTSAENKTHSIFWNAWDLTFHHTLSRLFPLRPAGAWHTTGGTRGERKEKKKKKAELCGTFVP